MTFATCLMYLHKTPNIRRITMLLNPPSATISVYLHRNIYSGRYGSVIKSENEKCEVGMKSSSLKLDFFLVYKVQGYPVHIIMPLLSVLIVNYVRYWIKVRKNFFFLPAGIDELIKLIVKQWKNFFFFCHIYWHLL